ncbi:uncharacterized protein BJ212DRAFT_1304932 [Suillus subaureus]|uniref:Uncharacterized protein n=1 Tax=Suillus subaureus TaxID=48587 RepID=A0A9P7DSJ3_9AGAM|nr:uncharacterized protein BJ212DRAFT_1304932 [Suillus subaureus]KAG1801939.1 hypothetical protein BJ212DRAFT_1304932 [Suillus subaureus]
MITKSSAPTCKATWGTLLQCITNLLVDDFTAVQSGFGIETLRMKKATWSQFTLVSRKQMKKTNYTHTLLSHTAWVTFHQYPALFHHVGTCRRHGQNKTWATGVSPVATDIPTASAAISAIPAAIPAAILVAAAANATTLQHPHQCQLPVRYRTSDAASAGPDEGEVFDLDNVSGDEEELENLAAPATMVPAGSNPSPLQTVTSTVHTDPLATGNLKQPKGPTDINHFYQIDPDMKSKTCIPCETLHEIGTTHKVMIKDLNEHLAEGWSLKMIREQLKKLPCTMQSLGPPPNKGSGASLGGTCSPEDQIPDFMLDEMHCQIVKFIVADDQ